MQYIQYMKKTVLVFPDTISMVDFLLIYKISGAETNSVDLTVSGRMNDQLVSAAITEYGAEIKNLVLAERM